MKFSPFAFSLSVLILAACSDVPVRPSPDWIRTPTRTVDAGYIVYVGTGEDPSSEKSQFKAEASAIQDLANECSFPPKGTRIEDRYQEKSGAQTLTFVKVGVSFQDCEQAKSANDAEEIRKVASVPLTEQLQKYQERVYAPAEESEAGETNGANPMLTDLSGPLEVRDSDHYFRMRQRIAFIKRDIILQPAHVPPAAPIPRIPPPVGLSGKLQTASLGLRNYEANHPEVKTWHRSWSEFDQSDRLNRTADRSSLTKPTRQQRREGGGKKKLRGNRKHGKD